MKNIFLFLIFIAVVPLEFCSIMTGNDHVVLATAFENKDSSLTSTPIPSLVVQNNSAIDLTPPPTTTPEFSGESFNCWESVLEGNIKDYGNLLKIAEGPLSSLWFLYNNVLVQLSQNGTKKVFDFRKWLGCEDCMNIINGTLAIAPSGDAWVGLSTGLLIIEKSGKWKILTTSEIVPQIENGFGVNALLHDEAGNIWVGVSKNLCSFNGKEWNCKSREQLNGNDRVISVAKGKGDQIWFGTFYGDIVEFNRGEFLVTHLADEESFRNVSSLAFDYQTSTLWAVSSALPLCENGVNICSPRILQVNSDGSIVFHDTSLFAIKNSGMCAPPVFTSVAITPDGIVWVGMFFCHNLVYYDGKNWTTIRGKILPYIDSDAIEQSNENSCSLGGYVTNVFVTTDGRLLISNQTGDVIAKK